MKIFLLFNKKGNSLIQVLVSIAILSVIVATTASLFDTQNKEMKSLSEKLAISEISTQINNRFLGPNFCSCLLRGRTFNSTDLTLTNPWNPGINSIPNSYTAAPPFPAACTPSAELLVPAVNQVINGTRMRVASINFENTTSQGAGYYTSNLVVQMQANSVVRLLNPVSVPVKFQVNTTNPPAAQSFVSCNPSAAGTTQRKFAFYNPNLITIQGTEVLNSGVINCLTNRALIEFGGNFSQVGDDRRGFLNLRVNGVVRNQVRGGARSSGGGDITASPGAVHGVWIENCLGNITATTTWENFSDPLGPQISLSYLIIEFLD